MKKQACALIVTGILTLLCPGWCIPQEDPGSLQQGQRAQQKRLLQQKQQELLTQMKIEFQQKVDSGYTPEQLEQWQWEQNAKIMGELKRLTLEKPGF